MEFVHAYDVLTQARRRLFDWVRPLSQDQYTQRFPFGLGTLRATLVEIAAVELLNAMRLRGEPLAPPVAKFPETFPISEARQSTFADLERAWTEQAKHTRATLPATTDWTRTVSRRSEQGDKLIIATASMADVATQMLMHEVHHRAQAMAMLRQLGVAAENLDYIAFAAPREERQKDRAPAGN